MIDPKTGHFWTNGRCQYCGIKDTWIHKHQHCRGVLHQDVEDEWIPESHIDLPLFVPVFTDPVEPSPEPVVDTFRETAFADGESGGGGASASFDAPVDATPAESPSVDSSPAADPEPSSFDSGGGDFNSSNSDGI